MKKLEYDISKLVTVFSQFHNKWGIYEKTKDRTKVKLKWLCRSRLNCGLLANGLAEGMPVCRGTKELHSNCSQCIKCKNTIDTM